MSSALHRFAQQVVLTMQPAEYDPELLPVAEAIDPLAVINAITFEEFKSQIVEAGDQIAQARQALIELVY